MLWQKVKYLLWLLLLINASYSQFATFNHLTTDQGLSFNSISCINQDPKGFIWIGTYEGLNKYDGYKITQNLGSDSATNYFAGALIKWIHTDKENNLWTSLSDDGLTKLDLLTGRLTHYRYDSASKNCIASNFIYEIKELEDGIIYIATNRGLSLFNKKNNTFTNLSHSDSNENSLLADNVRSITKDINGHIWIAHSGFGITEYIPKENKFIRYTMSDSKFKLLGSRIRNLFADSKGLLWISMWQSGIAVYDTKTGYFWNANDTTKKYQGLKKIGLISEFIEDKNGDIWMCGAEKGIVHYDKETDKATSFTNNPDDPQTISDNTNLCVMEDRTGLIWSGTWKGGLNYFNPATLKFGHIKHESNKESTMNDSDVLSFFEKSEREIIIGTGKNICIFDPVTFEFKKSFESKNDREGLVENSQVNYIYKDSDGSMWFCTNGAGAYQYPPNSTKAIIHDLYGGPTHSLTDIPLCITPDKNNDLWIGSWDGALTFYDRKANQFSTYLRDPQSELFSRIIPIMVTDTDGQIWIATQKNGLILLEPKTKKFTKIDAGKNSIFSKGSIGTILIDSKNKDKLWITCDGHLLEFDRKTFNYIDHTEISKDLYSEFVGSVQDEAGHLWLSSSHDLFRFNPATKHFTVYTKQDGTQDQEFNANAILKLSNNKILIGGTNGFNYFDPKDIHFTNAPPPVVFTDLLVLNKPGFIKENISYVNELTLDYKDYFFSISFAAVDFANPNANQFMYKMDGLDKDWIDIGNQHQLTFTNLDPGDYTLNIKASNSKGKWNETPLQLKITITPPFWRTKWFYALCLIVIIGSVYSYIKYREKKLRQEKEILERKVDERTHELNEEKLKVEEAHKDIKDSIYYAQKIQSAIIPSEEDFKKILPDSFVLFQPKDIVSGDFYWIVEKDEFVFTAIADCTGHGVPGGFMTMLGSGMLNETVNEQKLTEPAEILNKLREKIISTLKQTGRSGENKDGMDIVLLRFNKKTRELAYACANNGFLLIENGVMTEHYGDKQPVGIYGHDIKPFTACKMTLNKGAILYSYTDGYPDQFGGPKGKKFKYKTLNELIIENSHLELSYQKDKLHDAFAAWKGEQEQIDDVCVVGIRF